MKKLFTKIIFIKRYAIAITSLVHTHFGILNWNRKIIIYSFSKILNHLKMIKSIKQLTGVGQIIRNEVNVDLEICTNDLDNYYSFDGIYWYEQ